MPSSPATPSLTCSATMRTGSPQLGTEATRIAKAGGHLSVATAGGRFMAENVVC
ncbi:glycine/D-amino acid oxidase-like deaminating enzyme [Arthrobacter sp. TE12231]